MGEGLPTVPTNQQPKPYIREHFSPALLLKKGTYIDGGAVFIKFTIEKWFENKDSGSCRITMQ